MSAEAGHQPFRRVRTETGISGSSETGSITRKSMRKHGTFGGFCYNLIEEEKFKKRGDGSLAI